ncbi:MAG: hypothetical protein FJZ76_04350 [Bacteroidetes bacterium]|nr:hypothetical protein [Bacteroidota bacterium]
MGAKLKRTFGPGPKNMMVLPIARVMNARVKSIAGQLDIIPMLNMPAFGQCKSPANPMNWKMIGLIPVLFLAVAFPYL